MVNKIIVGDAHHVLKQIPNNTIDMLITSPPYFNLRDYKEENQIGSEVTIEDYINNLRSVFTESVRVQ